LRKGQGRAQREPACTCAYRSMGRVEADGAVPAQLPPAEEPSSLSVRSIGLASGVRAQRYRQSATSFMHQASHALGMHDRHVRCPRAVRRVRRNRCARHNPVRRDKCEREREREGGRKRTSDRLQMPTGSRELSRHVPWWHFVLSRSAN